MDRSTYAPPPARFEAGTPAIGEAIALGAACDYLMSVGMDRVHAYEQELGGLLHERLLSVDGVPYPAGFEPRPVVVRSESLTTSHTHSYPTPFP